MTRSNHKNNDASAIRAVILDYGEVLCFQPAVDAIRRIADVFQIDPNQFLEFYVPTRGPYDQGLLTPEEYWQDLARRADVKIGAALVEKLRRWDTEMWSTINLEMTGWVEQLHRAGLMTALLSNMQHDMAAHARKSFAWLEHFDYQIFSCALRLIKPDEAIFRQTVELVGVKAHDTLFVDDREANVQAARAVGLQAVQFQNVRQLRADLEKIGFEILPQNGRMKRPKPAKRSQI